MMFIVLPSDLRRGRGTCRLDVTDEVGRLTDSGDDTLQVLGETELPGHRRLYMSQAVM